MTRFVNELRRRVAIQRNPNSGSGRGRRELLSLVNRLRQHGLHPSMFSDRERLDEWVHRHSADLLCVVAAGGDGTINDVMNRLPGQTLAILPLGTENLLARYFRIPRSGRFVADMIHAGIVHDVDLGDANGRRFALMASVGVDSEIVRRVDSARTGTISRSTYLGPMLQAFWQYEYPTIHVTVDGKAMEPHGIEVMAVNIPRYAMGLKFAQHARDNDGSLQVRLFTRRGPWQMLRYLANAWLGRLERLTDVHCHQGRVVEIDAIDPLPVQIDGDPCGTTPLRLSVIPASQRFLVPRTFRAL